MYYLFLVFILMTDSYAGSLCSDGTYSKSSGHGACSHHGGVSHSVRASTIVEQKKDITKNNPIVAKAANSDMKNNIDVKIDENTKKAAVKNTENNKSVAEKNKQPEYDETNSVGGFIVAIILLLISSLILFAPFIIIAAISIFIFAIIFKIITG